MAATSQSKATIKQLEQACRLCLEETSHFLQVVPGILGIVGPSAPIDIRRWGANFIAYAVSYPSLPAEQRQKLALAVLPTVREYLDPQDQDGAVVESSIGAATTIYPIIFRHVTYNPDESTIWDHLVTIKMGIINRMDQSSSDVRPTCQKFLLQVILVQTPGTIASADPRRTDQNDVSISLAANDHPLIKSSNLQPEALGLLDRLLSVFQDTESNVQDVDALLNCLLTLVLARAALETKIINVVLSFNPLAKAEQLQQQQQKTISMVVKIVVRSMAKTVSRFLTTYNKRKTGNLLSGRIQMYLAHIERTTKELLDDNARKRVANEPTDASKRPRVGGLETPPAQPTPPTQSMVSQTGPVSLAQLYTLTDNEGHKTFDVGTVPLWQAAQLVTFMLGYVDQSRLDNAVNTIRHRYMQAKGAAQSSAAVPTAAPGGTDDYDEDDEYEPDEGPEAIVKRSDQDVTKFEPVSAAPAIHLGPLVMAQPPPMTEQEAATTRRVLFQRIMDLALNSPEHPATPSKKSFNSTAVDLNDPRKTWLTMLMRLATRPLAGLHPGPNGTVHSGSDEIRELLYKYVLEDFRKHLDTATSWFNEEWYNDKVQGKDLPQNYEKWMLRYLDGILPYLDATKDRKTLLRFLSEVPVLSDDVFQRVKKLAQDPEAIPLAVDALHYLILMKIPARKQSIDTLEHLYRNHEDARASTGKLLKKWRPEALDAPSEATPQTNSNSLTEAVMATATANTE